MLLQESVHGKTYIQHSILVWILVWLVLFFGVFGGFFCRHETNPQNSGMCFTVPYSSKQDTDNKN